MKKTWMILAAAFCLAGAIRADTVYQIQALSGPGGYTRVFFNGLNDAGTLVGRYTDPSGIQHGFVDNAGSFATYDYLSGGGTYLQSISNSGEIVGGNGNPNFGFADKGGVITTFGGLSLFGSPASLVSPTGVNSAGEIIGRAQAGPIFAAFTVSPSGTTTVIQSLPLSGFRPDIGWGLSGINDAGDIVGNYGYLQNGGPLVRAGFLLSPSGNYTLLKGPATAINSFGEIVGDDDSSIDGNSYIYQNGAYQTFGFSGAFTNLLSVNDSGQILGFYTTTGADFNYFLATPTASAVPEPSYRFWAGAWIAALAILKSRGFTDPSA